MVINMRKSITKMNVKSNGGQQTSIYKVDLPGFFEVWLNSKSMLNILPWPDVCKKFRITVDTDTDTCINIHLSKDKIMKLSEISSGLYIWSPVVIKVDKLISNSKPISAYSFLNLVSGNKMHFTARKIAGVERSRGLFNKLGMPGYK